MSEPKTIRDAWDRELDKSGGRWLEGSGHFLRRYGDHGFIPGANAVVTPQGLDAGCAAQLGCEGAPPSHWDDMPESEKEAWRFKLRIGLEAAGIRVAKEVYERVVELRTQVIPTATISSGTVKYTRPKPCTVAILEKETHEAQPGSIPQRARR